jgi:hypothetical protein
MYRQHKMETMFLSTLCLTFEMLTLLMSTSLWIYRNFAAASRCSISRFSESLVLGESNVSSFRSSSDDVFMVDDMMLDFPIEKPWYQNMEKRYNVCKIAPN